MKVIIDTNVVVSAILSTTIMSVSMYNRLFLSP